MSSACRSGIYTLSYKGCTNENTGSNIPQKAAIIIDSVPIFKSISFFVVIYIALLPLLTIALAIIRPRMKPGIAANISYFNTVANTICEWFHPRQRRMALSRLLSSIWLLTRLLHTMKARIVTFMRMRKPTLVIIDLIFEVAIALELTDFIM